MQAVVVLRSVLKKQRSRSNLTRLVAALQKGCVILRKTHALAHALVPLIGDRHETGVSRRTQLLDEGWKWVIEVLVLTPAEAVPGHNDLAAEALLAMMPGN